MVFWFRALVWVSRLLCCVVLLLLALDTSVSLLLFYLGFNFCGRCGLEVCCVFDICGVAGFC